MNRRTRLATIAILFVAGLASDADADDCVTKYRWDGTAIRGLRTAVSGDRVLIRYGDRAMVTDREGNRIAFRDGLDTGVDHLIGADDGFFEVYTWGDEVKVTRLDSEGRPAGAPVQLNDFSPGVMNPAQAAYANGLLFVTWAEPQSQYSQARDIHVVLIDSDGIVLAEHEITGRDGAYYSVAAAQDDVTWILWREDPYLQIKGMRFSTETGELLDEAPIAIASGLNGFRVAHAGDELRLYGDDPSGEIPVFELFADGSVTANGLFQGTVGDQTLGLASGDVVHVQGAYDFGSTFPAYLPATFMLEDAAGQQPSFFELSAAETRVLLDQGELVIISADDFVDGSEGASRLVMRRVSLGGEVVAQTVLEETSLEYVSYEICGGIDDDLNYYDGCSVGSRDTPAGLPLLILVAGFIAVRRRTRS